MVSNTSMLFLYAIKVIIMTSRVLVNNKLVKLSQLLSSDVFVTVFHSSKTIVGQLHYF